MLAEYCLPLVKVGGLFIALKGARSEAELGESAIDTLGGKIEQVVSLELSNGESRNIVFVRKYRTLRQNIPESQKNRYPPALIKNDIVI